MPGIVGILKKHLDPQTDHEVGLMVEALRHEKHYRGGRRAFPEVGLCVGWMGHAGGFDDCMPLVSPEHGIVIVFQGENFTERRTCRSLQDARGSVDVHRASYLLDLYAEFGDELPERLNGWFCGVIIDLRQRKVTLFNDRFGMGRIYFHEDSDEFLFGSEAKALLKVRPKLRAIDPAGLAQHLRYNCVLDNRTLYRGVELLPHASNWEFAGGSTPIKRSYFRFSEWEEQSRLGHAEFFPRFAEVLSTAFPAYAGGASKVAFSLTAGLDTRAILAALQGQERDVPCYTFGGPWRELYDIKTARKLAGIHGQAFSTITADQRFLKRFGEFAERAVYVSDGTHDAFGAHDIYFNQVARDIAPVRLTGKFGSEIVRVRNLVPTLRYPERLLLGSLGASVDALPPFSQLSRQMHPLTRVVTQEIPWHEFGRIAAEQSQLIMRTPYMDNELVKLMYRAPAAARGQGDLQEQYVKTRSPELAGIPTNLGRFTPGGAWAKKVHYGLLWALFKVEYIYLYATPHLLTRLDRALAALHLERLFAGRQKWEGYRIWIQTEFSEFIQDTLCSPHARYGEFLERRIVERMVARHIRGTHNHLNVINRALTLELICSTMLRRS